MWKQFNTEIEKVIKELQDKKFYLENSNDVEYYLEIKHKELFDSIKQLNLGDQAKVHMKIFARSLDPNNVIYNYLNEHLQEYLDHKINYKESEQSSKKDPSELSPEGQEVLAQLKQHFKNVKPEDITTVEELKQIVKDYKQDHKKEFIEKIKSFDEK